MKIFYDIIPHVSKENEIVDNIHSFKYKKTRKSMSGKRVNSAFVNKRMTE